MKKQLLFCLLVVLAFINTAKGQWSLTGNAGTTAGTNFIGTTDTKDLVFKTSSAERFRILSTGKIGIGTPAPLATLHVYGDQEIGWGSIKIGLGSAAGASLGYGTSYLGLNALRNPATGNWTIDGDGANNGGSVIWGNVVGTIKFATIPKTNGTAQTLTDAQVNSAVKMIITDLGNVGIGTSDPGLYRLAVEGTIGAREIKVLSTSFADFVFKKDYKLMPIKELESYISLNGHLPEIPSALQVEKDNGILLGEMQVKLLQKTEELTLYIIQLQKQIDELKASIKR